MLRKFFCFACRQASGNAGRDCRPADDNQKSVSGFSSKKVLTSPKRHRQFSRSGIFGFFASPSAKTRQPILGTKLIFRGYF
ncbi:MAG: hypothetical protein WC507_02125 [Candidatus Paceibacterota bacterium]